MKSKKVLSIAILPILFIWFTMLSQKGQQGKDKGKNNSEKNKVSQNQNDKKNKRDDQKGLDIQQPKGKSSHYDKGKGKNKNFDYRKSWDDGKWDNEKFNNRLINLKGNKRKNWVNVNQYYGVNWFGDETDYKIKKPKNYKKITLCHKPNGSLNPTTISVSLNALKAHLRHGDIEGNCSNDFDRGVYTDKYWNDRNTYYTQYYQTTETLSFGEQLLSKAIDVLTNRKSQLDATRATLTPNQIQQREVVLVDLQNSVYSLESNLERGNQRVSLVNFTF